MNIESSADFTVIDPRVKPKGSKIVHEGDDLAVARAITRDSCLAIIFGPHAVEAFDAAHTPHMGDDER
jgi:hypothetical protein